MTHPQERPDGRHDEHDQKVDPTGDADTHKMDLIESLQHPLSHASGQSEAAMPPQHSYAPERQKTEGMYGEVEPAWCAARALMHIKSDILLKIMLRSSFRPMQDTEFVPIYPCPHCGDGGLRTAGTLRMRNGGRAFVRACDTCCAVEVGEQQVL